MSVRKVLAPLLGGPNDGPTLSAAIAVSEDLEAHLQVCFVRPDPKDAVPYLGFTGARLEEIREEYRRHAETTQKKAANRARRQFNAACKKHGIAKAKRLSDLDRTSAHWVEVVGRATREVPEAAKLCVISVFSSHALLSAAQEVEASLLVMGGYAHNRFEGAIFGGTTLHAMRHTHFPLLMMH